METTPGLNEADGMGEVQLPDLAQRVRALREARHWTQAELARSTRLSRAYIKTIEDGWAKEPSARTIGLLAQSLGVHVIDLMQSTKAVPHDYHECRIHTDLDLTMYLRRQRRLSEAFVNTLMRLIELAELDEQPQDTAAVGIAGSN